MQLLPRKIGSLTLLRKLDVNAVSESYEGLLDGDGGQRRVLARRIVSSVMEDAGSGASVQARVQDLLDVVHPYLVAVLDFVELEGEHYVIEEWQDGISIAGLINWCRDNQRTLPHNIYLRLATQMCSGIEALHGRQGKGSGSDHVLHMGLRPQSITITPDYKIVLGGYGATRSPVAGPQGAAAASAQRVAYLAPEQTHADQKLSPPSDIFALGSVLYELLMLEPLFGGGSPDAVIQKVRRGEITAALVDVKERLPGLDKILFRALSVNPRHRYQRAFVLREDLRGLMAGFSFSAIDADTTAFLGPVLSAVTAPATPAFDAATADVDSFDDQSSTRIDPDPTSTAAIASAAAAQRANAEQEPGPYEDVEESPTALKSVASVTAPPPPPVFDAPARPTIPFAEPPDRPTVAEDSALDVAVGADADAFDDASDTAIRQMSLDPMDAPIAGITGSFAPLAPLDDEEDAGEDTANLPPATTEAAAFADESEVSLSEPMSVDDFSEEVMAERSQNLAAVAPPPKASPAPPPPSLPNLDAPPSVPATADWTDEVSDTAVSVNTSKSPTTKLIGFGVAAVLLLSVGIVGVTKMLGPDAAPPPVESSSGSTPSFTEIAPKTADEEPVEAADADQAEAPATAAVEASTPSPSARSSSTRSSTSRSSSRRSTGRVDEVPELETYDDGLADFDYTATEDLGDGGLETTEESTTNVGQYSTKAAQGALSSTEVLMLEMIDTTDPEYTRSRLLLVMDARRKGDQRGMKRYLDDVMSQPENAYNPVVLTEYGRYYANRGDYERALQKATLAERHWARIPSELIFMKKAEIYEIQAAAYQGLFYKSEDNLDLLDKSIRGWTKYRDHAATKSRGDLSAKATREITKLQSIRERLQ